MSSRPTSYRRTSWFEQVLLVAAVTPLAILPPHALALPEGGSVVSGSVSTDVQGNTMTLTQTGNAAIMNWTGFGIGAGESVTINQAVDAALLNRVTGANASELLGQLSATGGVFLINPNGVVIGSDATINAQEFIASTQDVADADFIDFANGSSDALLFDGDSTAAVSNAGAIVASDGDVILVGYRVDNSGTITAANGVAGLAAGKTVWFKPQSAQHLIIESSVSAPDADAADGTGVTNSGNVSAIQAELKAAAANVYALAINQTGVIAATGVENRDGRILLTADQGTIAHTAGSLTAHNADGSGGEVLVGGDYYGLDPDNDDNGVHLAASTTIGAGATIDVSASAADAAAGRAVVWSGGNFSRTGSTTFAGTINAQGGAGGGDGGFAVVAGHQTLDYSGAVDVGADAGNDGTLVLGLPHVTISDTATHDTANYFLSNTVLATQLGSANVVIDAFGRWIDDTPDDPIEGDAGYIRVSGDVAWSSTNGLNLKSGHTIRLNADLDAPNAPIELQAMGVDTFFTTDTIYSDFGSSITADRLTIRQNVDSEFIGFNPPPESSRHLGRLDFQGPVKVDTLDLQLENGGITFEKDEEDYFEGAPDAIRLYHSDNEIGTLNVAGDGILIDGNIRVVDSTGDLTVTGDFSKMGAGAYTAIETAGSLTLEGDTRFAASTYRATLDFGEDSFELVHRGGVMLAALDGSFINNSSAGAEVMTLGEDNHFAIYSDHPDTTVKGGLSADPYYGQSIIFLRPRDIGELEQSNFFYSFQPTLTFSASASRTYGDANPTLEYTVTGLLEGDDLARAFSGSPDLSTNAASSDGVGDYAIAVEQGTVDGGSYGYAFAFTPGTLTVNPAPLTIRADDQVKTVGGVDPTFTATYTGFVNGDTSAVVSGLVLTADHQPDSAPGDYTITPSGATAANYDITYVNGILSISDIPTLLISADDFNIIYGDAIPSLTATFAGFVGQDDASIVSGLTLSTVAVQGSGVGVYSIVPTGASASGYEIEYRNGTLTINPALLTIAAQDASRAYGSANPSWDITYSGLVNGEDASVVSGLTVSTAATASSAVGDYAIAVSGASAANYAITFTPGTLTVNPAPLILNVADASKIYADLNPTFSATASGLVLDETLDSLGTLTLSTAATQLTGIGDYAINATTAGTGFGNYEITLNPGTLTITARPVTAYANHVTRTYGDANPTVTWGLRGNAPPGMNLISLIDPGALTFTTEATAASDVGVYDYVVGGITNPNLDVTYEAGSITVDPAVLTVGVPNRSRTYGSANPAFTTTVSGLKLSDTLADVVPDLSYTTAATVTSNVGSYAVTPGGTVATGNYHVTFNPGTLTVTKAPLFIAPTLSSRLYGDADPTFAITAAGLLNNDTTAVVTGLNFSGSAPTAAVGTAPISILGATAQNYALTFGTGVLNILPRPLTITANDFSREYGEANPTFSATFDGLASFDSSAVITGLNFSTVATTASSVIPDGGYAINVSSNANRNYAITYEPGTLTVTPAPLVFGSGSFFRIYGQASPEIGADLISGLKLTDTADMLGATVVGPAADADVGTYAITVALSNPNYTVPNPSGEMQVLPATIGVNVGNVARRYGDANPDQSEVPVTVSGLAFGQTAFEVLSLDFGVDATAGIGNYPISVDLFSPNYQIADLSFGNLAVLTRQIALKPTNILRYYGDGNPAYHIQVAGDGLAAFDTIDDVAFSDLLRVDSILTDALPSSLWDAGLHQIRVQPTGNPNYEIISVPGLFVILPRPVTLTTADATATENRTPPTFVTTATNLAPGQTLQSAFPDLTHNVYAQDAPAAVGVPLTPTTYPVPDAFSEAAFFAAYPAEPAAARPPGAGQVSVIVPIEIDFPTFEQPAIIRSPITLTPIQLLALNGLINPATLGEQPTDAPEPVINFIQPVGYQSNPNYVVTTVNNGTLTIEPDPIIVAERKAAAEAAAAANELPNARAAFFTPEDNQTAFGLPVAALPAFVNAVYNQVAYERFDGGGNSELQARIVEMLGLEPGSGYTEAQLYRLMAQIPHNLEVRALFAPVLDAHIRSLVGRAPDSLNSTDQALVAAVNDRLAAQQARFASAARQAAQAEMQAYQAEQAASRADRNLVNLFGRDIPYDQIVKDALGSVVEETMTARLAELIDESSISDGANVALTTGVSAAGAATGFVAAGATVAALLPYGAGRGVEIAATVAQAVGTATGAGAAAGAVVATAVVATVVMSIQRGIQIGDSEGQRLIYESLVNGTAEAPTLSDMNLDQTKGSGAKKLDAALNENLLSLAIFDLITG